MRPTLRLTLKVTLTFVVFAVVLLSIVGFLAYRSGRSGLEESTFAGLLSTAIEKEASLETWIAEAQSQIAKIGQSPYMREKVAVLRSAANDLKTHDEIVGELLPQTGTGNIFRKLAILEPDTGKIIASTDPDEEGTFKEDRPYFVNGQKAAYVQNVYFSLGCQCPAMTAAAPIKSNDGELLAVLSGQLNLDDMGTIINRTSAQYQTADAYLVNTSNLLVNQPRFVPDAAILQRGVYTEAVQRCLLKKNGSILDTDYRGIPAMAVFRWLSNRNLCLVVKVDQSEALEPVAVFGRTLLVTAGVALLGASLLAVSLAQTITLPILTLKNAVTQFGQGKLQLRFPKPSQDEIGELAREFNTMADAIVEKEKLLQDYAKNLEERVNERTAQLSFLVTASQTLSESFDYSARLKKVAELAVPKIADWCTVDILDDDGVLQRVAVVHTDPQKVAYAYELQRRFPPDPNAAAGNYNVIRTGKSEFYPNIPDELITATTNDAEIIDIIRQLGLKSSMTVPLTAHGHTFGTMTLVMAESGRHFDASDLSLVEDLAGRAALLIDNAKLFSETQQLNTELEQRVQERTAHLTAVNKELEAFSYSVSHDLRAPLRAVDGFSQALLEDYNDSLDAMGQDFLNRIRNESQRMGHLIDDLIGLSRYSRTEMNFVEVDLSKIAGELLAECKEKEPDRVVEISIQEGVVGCGDERLIRVALQNLINNAWKFTSKTPQARIEFGCTQDTNPPEYYVRDNGAGFDMAYVSKLFGAFQRLHGMNEFTGTGIGLATVQRIMHRHGGFIRAEGKVNAGAAFYFTLGENNCV
ncbi:MAG: HAMP domain-containing protein [Anaerolineaceae bacterium]|nr:HAMP domain-containing protein [Anaerolineaceae bacterium]